MEKFINIKRAIQLLGISQSTIRRWIHSNKIPYYKLGGNYKFIESELKEFILKYRFGN